MKIAFYGSSLLSTYWNGAAERATGSSRERALGRLLGEMLPFLRTPAASDALNRVRAEGVPLRFMEPVGDSRGVASVRAAPLPDGGLAIDVRDATEELRRADQYSALLDSMTVRAAADAIGIHCNTSFRWRHRFLAMAKNDRPKPLCGIVEVDETYLLESQKGSRHMDRPPRKRGGKASRRGISREFDCILVARDRNRQTCDFVTGRGPVSASQLAQYLRPVLAPDVLLVTDAARSYHAFAQRAGITHETVNVKKGIRARGAIHIQNVNGWHSRFKTWLRRFNGVASRYLANYTGWQRVLDAAVLTMPRQWLGVAVEKFSG